MASRNLNYWEFFPCEAFWRGVSVASAVGTNFKWDILTVLSLKDHLGGKQFVLRPKIHGYAGCKRTWFVKPDRVKLEKSHLLHDEAGP